MWTFQYFEHTREFGPYYFEDEAKKAFQRVYGYWPKPAVKSRPYTDFLKERDNPSLSNPPVPFTLTNNGVEFDANLLALECINCHATFNTLAECWVHDDPGQCVEWDNHQMVEAVFRVIVKEQVK